MRSTALWLMPLTLAAAFTACSSLKQNPYRQWTLVDEEAARAAGIPRVSHYQYPSGGHCSNWAGVVFLEVRADETSFPVAQFVRDPEGRLAVGYELKPFADGVILPPDAIWTGWRDGHREFWLAPDRFAAYIGSGDRWERWPAPRSPIGCS